MNRREFLRRAGGSALALAIAPAAVLSSTGKESFVVDGLTVGTTGADITFDFTDFNDAWRYALAQHKQDLEQMMLFGMDAGEAGSRPASDIQTLHAYGRKLDRLSETLRERPQTVTIKGFTWTES